MRERSRWGESGMKRDNKENTLILMCKCVCSSMKRRRLMMMMMMMKMKRMMNTKDEMGGYFECRCRLLDRNVWMDVWRKEKTQKRQKKHLQYPYRSNESI